MFQLDLKSRKSIYQQVIDNFKELIMNGVLKDDEKLPSVREISKTLTINPNTIQKAYRELERQEFIYTVSGLGTFVSPANERKVDERQVKSMEKRLREFINELRYLGLKENEIKELIEKVIKEETTND